MFSSYILQEIILRSSNVYKYFTDIGNQAWEFYSPGSTKTGKFATVHNYDVIVSLPFIADMTEFGGDGCTCWGPPPMRVVQQASSVCNRSLSRCVTTWEGLIISRKWTAKDSSKRSHQRDTSVRKRDWLTQLEKSVNLQLSRDKWKNDSPLRAKCRATNNSKLSQEPQVAYVT